MGAMIIQDSIEEAGKKGNQKSLSGKAWSDATGTDS
jgi:hypothetical protein